MQDSEQKIYDRILANARDAGEHIGDKYELKGKQFQEWFGTWCADKTATEIAEVIVGKKNVVRKGKGRKPKKIEEPKQIAGLSKVESDAVLKELEELKSPLQETKIEKPLQKESRKKASSI